jgi:hypothetical protein
MSYVFLNIYISRIWTKLNNSSYTF